MGTERMSTEDMLQYCKEALAWEDFGPIDTLFFETVRRIITGEIPPTEHEPSPDSIFDDEGFFSETETSGHYYNPEGGGTITFM